MLFGMLLIFSVALPINFFILKSRYFREQKNASEVSHPILCTNALQSFASLVGPGDARTGLRRARREAEEIMLGCKGRT